MAQSLTAYRKPGDKGGSVYAKTDPAEIQAAKVAALQAKQNQFNTVSLDGKTERHIKSVFGNARLAGCVKFSATTKRSRAGVPGVPQEDLQLPNQDQRAQLCVAPIAFEEQEYPARENDYRIFVEGVELSGYVRGALTWTIDSTGGTNSCRFMLNNNQDAFIVTPLNVCSNLSLNGWRIDTANLYAPTMHSEARYDEMAKYLIYKRKFERVAPGTGRADIDYATGMWYYPLAPMGLIFNKHDTVRVFRKLSHIDGARIYDSAGGGGELRNFDLWAPAFTGFIKNASYTDDYVTGDRSVTIECYDFRGLMEGMRVRTVGLRLGTNNPGAGAKAGPSTPMEKALGANFTAAQDTDIPFLLNTTYKLYRDACIGNIAATTQVSSAEGKENDATIDKMNGCLVSTNVKMKPFADEASKLFSEFSVHAAALKKVSGLTSVLKLKEAKSADGAVEFQKTGTTAASANSTGGGTTPGTPTNTAGSQSAASAPTLTAPTVPPKDLWKYAVDPKVGSPIGSPTLNANGDLERLDAIVAFIDRRPVLVNPYSNIEGIDESCKTSGVLTWDKFNTEAYNNLIACCGAGIAKQKGVQVGGSEASSLKASYCPVMWLEHLACLITKSVLSYAYSQLDGVTLELLKKNGACRPSGEVEPPLAVVSDKKSLVSVFSNDLLALVRTDIYSDGKTSWSTIKSGIQSSKSSLNATIENYKTAVKKSATDLWNLRQKLLAELAKATKEMDAAQKSLNKVNANRVLALKKLADDSRVEGQKKADAQGVPNAGNVGELILNEPTFEARQAGIFADLVKKVGQGTHPLEGMSYEAAVVWLCCAPTTGGGGPGCLPGRLEQRGYSVKALEQWNKLVLFGIAERPLTFDEVTAIGQESGSDSFKEAFSPYKPMLHIMLPPRGTGARTIVQQDLTANTGNSTSFQYETRKSLVDRISTLLNYQWYVSPWGDLIFEFPHYNSEPQHWGDTFKGAYILDKEITGITVNEESSDLYTAWVVTGMEASKQAAAAGSSLVAQNQFYKVSIMCPILARRVGVRVENINIELPGVGAQIDTQATSGGVDSLVAWALLHIQRQLGEAHRVNINDFPDRPYLLPNRPLYIVPRQKFCLTKSVTYTMDKPNGDATVSVECSFTRWLFRDGSFRQVAGGKGSIVDYTGIFTGTSTVVMKEGASKKSFGTPAKKSNQKSETSWDCASLSDAAKNAQSWYGQDLAGLGNEWTQYSGNTSGAAGLPGFIPPNSKLGQGQYGTAVLTKPSNPADKDAGNGNDPTTAGLRVEGKNPQPLGTSYNIKNLFLDPYPFGRPSTYTTTDKWKKTKTHTADFIHQFGFLKSTYQGSGVSFRDRNGDIEVGFHKGVDIMMPVGPEMVIPFDAKSLKAEINVGNNQHQYQKKQYVVVGSLIGGQRKIDLPEWQKFSTGAPEKIIGSSIQGEVFSVPYQLYLDQKKRNDENGGKKNFPVSTHNNGKGGIMITAYGTITAPNGSGEFEGKVVQAKLSYLHCHSILKGPSGYYGLEEMSVSKGVPVCKLGNTGTGQPHAHIELSIAKPGSANDRSGSGDSALFDEARKANNEFLTTQLLLKVTGGQPDSDKLAPYWQNYFKEWPSKQRTEKAGFPTPITTPKDAVTYLLSQQAGASSGEFRSGLTGDEFSAQSGWLLVNPLFFFKPEEMVPSFAKYADKHNYPPKDVPEWNSKAFASSIIADPASISPMCGKLSEEYKQRVQNNFSACMIAARQKASNSYGSYSAAVVKCRKGVKEEVKSIEAEARKKRAAEDAAARAKARAKAREQWLARQKKKR